jgi:hypothetical protein
MTMEAAVACPVRPQVDTGWLALPLSARGIIDELGKYTDENARVILQLDDGADADAVGKEIARLLCAHPGELAGVKRDTKKLLDRGDIAVDGSAIRLSRIAHETARSVVERPRAMTPAERQWLCRAREKAAREQALAASQTVTNVTTETPNDSTRSENPMRPSPASAERLRLSSCNYFFCAASRCTAYSSNHFIRFDFQTPSSVALSQPIEKSLDCSAHRRNSENVRLAQRRMLAALRQFSALTRDRFIGERSSRDVAECAECAELMRRFVPNFPDDFGVAKFCFGDDLKATREQAL